MEGVGLVKHNKVQAKSNINDHCTVSAVGHVHALRHDAFLWLLFHVMVQ